MVSKALILSYQPLSLFFLLISVPFNIDWIDTIRVGNSLPRNACQCLQCEAHGIIPVTRIEIRTLKVQEPRDSYPVQIGAWLACNDEQFDHHIINLWATSNMGKN